MTLLAMTGDLFFFCLRNLERSLFYLTKWLSTAISNLCLHHVFMPTTLAFGLTEYRPVVSNKVSEKIKHFYLPIYPDRPCIISRSINRVTNNIGRWVNYIPQEWNPINARITIIIAIIISLWSKSFENHCQYKRQSLQMEDIDDKPCEQQRD